MVSHEFSIYAICNIGYRLSARRSVTPVDQSKTVAVTIMQLSPLRNTMTLVSS